MSCIQGIWLDHDIWNSIWLAAKECIKLVTFQYIWLAPQLRCLLLVYKVIIKNWAGWLLPVLFKTISQTVNELNTLCVTVTSCQYVDSWTTVSVKEVEGSLLPQLVQVTGVPEYHLKTLGLKIYYIIWLHLLSIMVLALKIDLLMQGMCRPM